MKIVIIGNGIAGNQVAFTLIQQGTLHNITIISAENVPEYDPCSLPYFLGGDVSKNAVFRKKIADYHHNNIQLVFENKVVSIDPAGKSVLTDKGQEFAYDKLVLAHGGDLFIPPIEGVRNRGVFSCKQLRKTEKLNHHRGKSAVVIGSGAIGIEAAEALKKKGYEVTIVELMGWILPTLFDEPTARRLESEMEGYGIHVRTNEKVLKILGEDRVEAVVTDRRKIICDTVVVSTGVIPGTKLAQTAGIKTNRGILIDAFMQTSIPDIYACGDCVETVDATTGEAAIFQLKHNALAQGKIVAKNLAGQRTRYEGALAFARAHFFKTHAATFGKTLAGSKSLDGKSEIIEKEDGKNYLRVILMDGRIIGGQAIGNYADAMGLLIGAMRRRDNIHQLRQRWETIIRSDMNPLLPQLRLGHLFGL